MTRADKAVEWAAERLEQVAQRAAAQGGLVAKLGDELVEDGAFLRKLKPSLIVARARGELPTDGRPGDPAPGAPPPKPLPKPTDGGGGGPNPFVVVGAALAGGILLAKAIDWRGHAYPRV